MQQSAYSEPILRWAGGKRWLLPTIKSILGDVVVNNYHEPFLGGAAVFLGTSYSGRAFLSDVNSELIEVYECIRDDYERVSKILASHVNTAEHYYQTRDEVPGTSLERAARFIYLNHTSFNGIYRVNLSGKYNVPYGRRESINMPTLDILKTISDRLQNVQLKAQDFECCIENIEPGDLVFLDPPYTVAHNNNGFVKYNQKLFSWDDQLRLSNLIDKIKKENSYYILSNAAHDSIAELFEKGDRLVVTQRKNAVGGASSARGYASEYLFTNVGLA
ncbi:Dam family site-specific DNA-(adenine-N6)-methyltransferase [Nocardia sp. NBC_00565]|uniref:DNA adenine methylase n=1 Tax=Nocardia sp. NBC_00565 TaxID=2975993 RepID=UPI002E819016|nr:Dam family site-specific DNA-(adenine-N6)-methyltransferase [Nocardia sp. NBC_00565]WUC03521.1 Dam family site-specific DNA-(adenine-N6)-methyltransferase [Nocardia sp. NBC_00565]